MNRSNLQHRTIGSARRNGPLSALFSSQLEANLAVTYVIYFGYMAILSLGMFLLCGSIGYLSAYWFIVAIYSSIKVD